MLIELNGESKELPDGFSAAQLIDDLALAGKRIAMEINGEILPRSQYQRQCLVDGDHVEIVHAVGGG